MGEDWVVTGGGARGGGGIPQGGQIPGVGDVPVGGGGHGQAGAPPRELVVASAGAGKTYRLSQRIIELLDAGAEPSEVLASTFTRKAAGEILERVLVRLAEGAVRPGGLERDPPLSQERCLEILSGLVRRLHTVNVGTLDSFFQRVARAFSLEMGLPPVWGLSGGPADEALQARAVSALLEGSDRGELLELVRRLQGGEAGQGVHGLLMKEVAGLHDLFRDVDPHAPEPWGFPSALLEALGPPPERHEVGEVAGEILAQEVPRTKAGKPDGRWTRARDEAAERIRAMEWDDYLTKGLSAKVLTGEMTYYRTEIPPALVAALGAGIHLARRALVGPAHARTLALAGLLARYHRTVEGLREEEGRYRFDDVTRALGDALALERGDELHYRLDARIRHILLDEFQDTSLSQWRALRPLVAELLSGYLDERGAVVVADPKQSIYGWRGGEPRILDAMERDFSLERATLALSWRSSQVVLDLVNEVFGRAREGGVVEEDLLPALGRWLGGFEAHQAAHRALPGFVRIRSGPEGDPSRGSVRPRLLAAAARRVAELQASCPALEIGVLTRTNRGVGRLMAEFRRMGVEASGEGGVPVVDSPAVLSLLALLRLADHPGDRVARYQVARTPVADLLPDGADLSTGVGAEAVARTIRRRLLQEGYGSVLARWVEALQGSGAASGGGGPSPRDLRRLGQLVELAHRWDAEGGNLRPTSFLRWVEQERVQEPAATGVRVMTVHQSKGLEFDVVVLPDLDHSLLPRNGGEPLPHRPRVDGPVTRVYPALRSHEIQLFPEAREAWLQAREAGLRDGLSGLYVALTRARFAVEIFLSPDGRTVSTATSAARMVRASLGLDERVEPDQELYTRGDPEWWWAPGAPERLRIHQEAAEGGMAHVPPEGHGAGSSPDRDSVAVAASAEAGGAPLRSARGIQQARATPTPLFRPSAAGQRRRLLPRRTPSELEGGGRVRLGHLLLPGAAPARGRGALVHAWFEEVGWLEDGLPADEVLLQVARRVAPQEPAASVGELLERFREWVEHPAFARVLSAAEYPAGALLHRERPFLFRDQGGEGGGGRLLQGVVDRLVVDRVGQEAWILDFKTDRNTDPEALADRYGPQLAVYREAVAREEGIEAARIRTALVVLEGGRVQELGP